MGPYRCEFRAPGTPWPDAFAPVDKLAPYFTLDRKLYVIPGLFEQPAIAKRYADDEQRHLAREQRARFVATCRLKLVDHLKDFQTRWLKGGEWNHQDDAWVADPRPTARSAEPEARSYPEAVSLFPRIRTSRSTPSRRATPGRWPHCWNPNLRHSATLRSLCANTNPSNVVSPRTPAARNRLIHQLSGDPLPLRRRRG